MMIYNIIRSNVALSTTNDFFTILSGATRSWMILEIDCEGDGNTSGYNECSIQSVTTLGVTGGGAITPVPAQGLPSGSTPAFTGTVSTTWTTQPVVNQLLHNIPINSNGQRYFWRANPNLSNAITFPGGATAISECSVGRSSTGTGNISIRLQIAEL